jgi:multicomponent Na+:H+ antiporter subunit B
LKIIGLITTVVCGALLLFFSMDFPDYGDPTSPASTHLSPYYIENTLKDSHVPNIVTSVLADYRGYDTMYETTVVLAAGLACFFLLRRRKSDNPPERFYRHVPTGVTLRIEEGGKLPAEDSIVFRRMDSLWTPDSLIIRNTCRLVIGFIQLFALYVVAHGHYSPGGGFQGGVILASSIILFAISNDLRTSLKRIKEKIAALLGSLGVMIYAGTALICLLMGANFLDYKALAPILGTDSVMARSHGILFVEIGVAFAVMAVMIWLYYNLSSAGKHDEGL